MMHVGNASRSGPDVEPADIRSSDSLLCPALMAYCLMMVPYLRISSPFASPTILAARAERTQDHHFRIFGLASFKWSNTVLLDEQAHVAKFFRQGKRGIARVM